MKVFETKVTMDNVKINLIKPMTNSPFTVKEDEDMQKLRESISQFGLLSPIVIRQLPDTNEYEIVCGNRRLKILNELGYETAPALINNLSNDEALVAMIDSNLCHREHILPSEKGIAYKLKLDAMKRQGYRTDLDEPTSATVLQKLKGETSIQKLSEQSGDSRETIRHYIRLTYLISELLNLVDENRIAMRPAVELSYLTTEEQQMVYAMYDSDEVTPSFPQAQRMRRLSEEGELDNDTVFNIMSELKANQKDTVSIPTELFQKYIKGRQTPKSNKDFVIKAIEYYCRYLERQRGRDR